MVEEVNLDKLTPEIWEIIRKWDFSTLKMASRMCEPVEEDNE